MVTEPRISVIVPVWNGANEISSLLDALAIQTAPDDRYEVIVVDNGSTDDSVEVVKRYPFVRLLTERNPGSYAARNHGIAKATGDFLLFTDADCIPASDWVEIALELAEKHADDCLIGGRIDVFHGDDGCRFSVRYDELTAFQQRWNLANNACVTANWLCSKSLMERIGLFDSRLLSGGDWECARRIANSGYRLIYADELVVRHPSRATLSELVRKKRRVVGGRWQQEKRDTTFVGFSRKILAEYVDQARWMKSSDIEQGYKAGVLLVVGSLWAATQLELLRLRAGGRPRRQ